MQAHPREEGNKEERFKDALDEAKGKVLLVKRRRGDKAFLWRDVNVIDRNNRRGWKQRRLTRKLSMLSGCRTKGIRRSKFKQSLKMIDRGRMKRNLFSEKRWELLRRQVEIEAFALRRRKQTGCTEQGRDEKKKRLSDGQAC